MFQPSVFGDVHISNEPLKQYPTAKHRRPYSAKIITFINKYTQNPVKPYINIHYKYTLSVPFSDISQNTKIVLISVKNNTKINLNIYAYTQP